MSEKLTAEAVSKFTPPWKAPQMLDLAEACSTGACNVYALLRHLGQRVNELQFGEVRGHPAVLVVLGQLSYLCNESLGPSFETLENYERWKNQSQPHEENQDSGTPRPAL